MEVRINLSDAIVQLMDKGVTFVNPLTVVVGDEVDPERISGDGVVIYPGCRIHGAATSICAGAQLGFEAPVVVEDCQLGPGVQLKGGYFRQSVFLEKANMGLGAQVREACILEEEASGAHCVGLKQTILFPFVTLGSLINFCDCLMAGGISRKDHSEVGSSYIHFNFTPDGDKTTASLIGDVPRGVMLREPAIFLGGQGGLVGPAQVGYGNVIAAGVILRQDVPEDGRLVLDALPHSINKPFRSRRYPNLPRIVNHNLEYLASLLALEQWYKRVRRDFFAAQPLGLTLYDGALTALSLAKKERLKRLRDLAGKLPADTAPEPGREIEQQRKHEFRERIDAVTHVFEAGHEGEAGAELREDFLRGLTHARRDGDGYLRVIQGLPTEVAHAGAAWLRAIIKEVMAEGWRSLPSFEPSD